MNQKFTPYFENYLKEIKMHDDYYEDEYSPHEEELLRIINELETRIWELERENDELQNQLDTLSEQLDNFQESFL